MMYPGMELDEKMASGELELNEVEQMESASLEPQLAEIPEVGEAIVVGDPLETGRDLNDSQGENLYGAKGDCGLVTISNMLAMAGFESSEDEVVGRAISLGLCIYGPPAEQSEWGGTNWMQRSFLLRSYGINTARFERTDPRGSLDAIAQYAEQGHGVNLSVNAGYAWDDPNYIGDGSCNHSVLVTGTARDPESGELLGLYVCDSGRTDCESSAVFLPVDVLEDAYSNAAGAGILVTKDPIR